MRTSLQLARAGYCGGDPEKVARMAVGWVVAALYFERFTAEYQQTYVELNRKSE